MSSIDTKEKEWEIEKENKRIIMHRSQMELFKEHEIKIREISCIDMKEKEWTVKKEKKRDLTCIKTKWKYIRRKK
jgi:hypothetical protein